MAQTTMWSTFDNWTLTNCGQQNRRLIGCKGGHDFTSTTGVTVQRGTWNQNLETDVIANPGTNYSRISVDAMNISAGGGVIVARQTVSDTFGGCYGRGNGANHQNCYMYLLRSDTNALSLFRHDTEAPTQLATTAQTYTMGAGATVYFSFDSGGVSVKDLTRNVTVARQADATYASGPGGTFAAATAGALSGTYEWMYQQPKATPTTFTAVSTTFDAGSAVTFNALTWEKSLNGGAVTFDVSGVASGSPNWIETNLSGTYGAAFSASRSFRYWHVRINGTGISNTANAGVIAGSLRLINVPAATQFVEATAWNAGWT